MSSQSCPFCDLGDRVLKSNKHAQLFLSNPRKVFGHFLVSTKRHIEKPWDLKAEELLATFELINFAQKKIISKLATGCDIRQNYRPFMAQSRVKVDHVHFHVLPRDLNDELYEKVEKFETEMFTELTAEEFSRASKLLA